MILGYEEFVALGFKVSADRQNVEKSIFDAEVFYVKSVIGDANYIMFSGDLLVDTKEYVLKNGGEYQGLYFAGLKRAIANIAFAFLLRDNVNSVRFGSIRKYDENSSNIDENLLYNTSRHHFTIGKTYLREVVDELGNCDFSKANGVQFDEFNNLL